MKMMKRIGVLLLLAALMMMLTACGKFTCDMCGKEKSGKKHKVSVLGQESTLCDDCYKGIQSLGGALGF